MTLLYIILSLLIFPAALMFLAMIFGEQLSVFGIADREWLTAPFDFVNRCWELVCEASDRLWCFVFDHFWWVAATVTGSIGLFLIALLMLGGLSNEARAVRLDSKQVLDTGSVLDQIPEIEPRKILQTRFIAENKDESQLMYQARSEDRWYVPPVRRPIVRELPREEVVEFPEVEPTPSYRYPDYSRGQLRITLEPFVERIGRPVRSRELDQHIKQTLLAMRDDWRSFSSAGRTDRLMPLRNDTVLAEDDLYSRVRVIAGDVISANNLRIEKAVPEDTSGEFRLQVRVINTGRERIHGVVARELLPSEWTVVDMAPRGVYRDKTATWLIESLEPNDEVRLDLMIQSRDTGRFESQTEISATSAVSSPVKVRGKSRALPPIEYPRLKLTFDPRPTPATVGESVDIPFRIENIGRVPAVGVTLYVELPLALDHKHLDPTDLDRHVESTVNRLDPGQSRERVLVVRPGRDGLHKSKASLVLQGERLTVEEFNVDASPARMRTQPRNFDRRNNDEIEFAPDPLSRRGPRTTEPTREFGPQTLPFYDDVRDN